MLLGGHGGAAVGQQRSSGAAEEHSLTCWEGGGQGTGASGPVLGSQGPLPVLCILGFLQGLLLLFGGNQGHPAATCC